jgi:8-oxo-dGTP pyrophosphatase MutT (NUDIX family)
MRPWRRLKSERLQGCRVFHLDRVRYEPPEGGPPREFFVVDAPDWVNVIPVTDEGRVVLIRQFRFGTDSFTLEIPGGMCDGDEAPVDAAKRELLEETGHEAEAWKDLGFVHPNPAIQGNRCHTFLAERVRPVTDPSPDADEQFEIVSEPLDRVPSLIASGAISHALVVAAFYRLGA